MDNFYNYEGIFFWQNQKFGIFCHILCSFQIIDCGESVVHCGESPQLKKRNFLFVAVSHGDEPDIFVHCHDSRWSSTPWLMVSN